jgi:ABC-type enterochelin transport system substrate-binding protein
MIMKTMITLATGILLSCTVQAQDKTQKQAKSAPTANSQTGKVEKETDSKKVELDPNTRAKYDDGRNQMYPFAPKRNC